MRNSFLARVIFVMVVVSLVFEPLLSFVFPPEIYAYLATGGTITTSGEYVIHTFTSSGTFTPGNSVNVEYLVVAGGGGGGWAYGGGGGGGGVLEGVGRVISSGGKPVVVGSGGSGGWRDNHLATSGEDSTFDGLTAEGGGHGGDSRTTAGSTGDSGGTGGGARDGAGAGGAGSQGGNGGTGGSEDGYQGAGGGGMGQNGYSNTYGSDLRAHGGDGIANDISGVSTYYGGGGGAGEYSADPYGAGLGGLGGGGNGSRYSGTDGEANTGGGGGSAGWGYNQPLGEHTVSGDGGSGIVIIRYLQPTAPTIGSPSALSTSSIRWNFTDASSSETGFKVYDNGTPTLKVTCATANLTYCDESSLSPNTSYTRKVIAYNGNNNSDYSGTATKYTLATVPAAPTVNGAAATTLDVNPDPNGSPTTTEMVVYKEAGASCDGSGGSYLAANGSDNSSTPVWQAESSWATVTATGLSEQTQYSFCTKSRNGDNTETSWGSAVSGTTIESTSPSISSVDSVAGDASATYYDNTDDSSTVIAFTSTDGSGGGVDNCKWDTSDVAYDSMSNSCGSTSSCTVTPSGEGAKAVYLRCQDVYSNKMGSSQTVNYTIDATAPTTLSSTNSSASWTNAKPTVTVSTPADTLSGMNEIRYVWDSNDLGANCTAGTTTTATANITSTLTEGSHILYLCTSDNAGNVATWNGAYKWDNGNPLVNITTHALATYYTANIPAKIEGTASDVLSSISSVAISIYNGVKYWTGSIFDGVTQTWLAATGTTTWEYTFAPSSDADYTIYSRSTDGANNTQTSSATTFTYDTTAALLTVDPSATVTNGGATITWTTDEASSTRIEYGLSSSYGTLTTEVDTSPRVTSHSQEITNLASCTVYSYRVRSKDSATNEYIGTNGTFTTTGCTGSATVNSTTSTAITKTSGGSVELASGGSGVALAVPANFSSNDSTFQIKKLDTTTVILTTSSPTGFTVVGDHTYQLDALSDNSTTVTSFDNAITITITYDATQVTDLDLTSLVIQRWDGSAWNALTDCTVDTAAQTVTCTTSAFSTFGLFGEESVSDSTGSGSSSPPGPSCTGFGLRTPPDLFQANVTNTSAKLFFTPLLDSNSFHITYSTKKNTEEFAVLISLNNRGVQDFTINSLNPSTTYYFKVQAVNECASSDWSNTMKVKTNSKTQTKTVTYYKGNMFSRALSFITSSKPPKVANESSVEEVKLEPQVDELVEAKLELEPTPVPEQEGKQFCFFKWCFRVRLPW